MKKSKFTEERILIALNIRRDGRTKCENCSSPS